MVFKQNIQVSGIGEMFLHLPAGTVSGIVFDIVSANDTDLLGLRNTDNYIIPPSPAFIIGRVKGTPWLDNIIPVGFNTSVTPRFTYNAAGTINVNLYLFIDEPIEKKSFKFKVIKVSANNFDAGVLRFTPVGKLYGIDLVSLAHPLSFKLTNGSQIYLQKYTDPLHWTQRKQFFDKLLFPVKTNDRSLIIEPDTVSSDDVFYLVYTYQKFDQ